MANISLSDNKRSIVQALIAYCTAIAAVAIHFSPAVSSIGLAVSLLLAGYLYFQSPDFSKDKTIILLLPALIFIWQLITLFLLPPVAGTGQKLLMRLPLVALLFLVSQFNWNNQLKWIWINILSVVPCWISLASVINYLRHFRFLNQMILESKPLPIYTQVYHIEFSFILAITSLIALLWLLKNYHSAPFFARNLLLATTSLNIICLHILSVRTGIVCFWTGISVFTLYSVLNGKISMRNMVTALLLFAVVAAFLPSVRNRVINTVEDFRTVTGGGDLNGKSFGQRWEAWRASLWVIKQNPLAGVGMKGVEDALAPAYDAIHSTLDISKRVLPHNEFLDLSVQSGLPAGLLLLLFFMLGWIYAFRKKNLLLMAVLPAIAVSMLFESLLERQAGVLFFVLIIAYAFSLHESDSKT